MIRSILFDGIINGRDLGGLVTSEGRTIRTGLLLRTANLAQATDNDLQKLKNEYRLSLVVDLRTQAERNGKPDKLPEGTEYLPNPIFDEATAGITRENDSPSPFALPDMTQLYKTMVLAEPCRAAFHRALMAIFTHDYEQGAVLWHCTAGKDRCGMVSMLVLAALGVGRSEIMKDYAVNPDEFIAQADGLYRQILRSGREEPVAVVARDVFLALPKYMESAFEAIDEQYGSIRSYLVDGLSIPESVLSGFQIKLLV